jgi:hypothetical protein
MFPTPADDQRPLEVQILLGTMVRICNVVDKAMRPFEFKKLKCRPGSVGSVVRIYKTIPGRLSVCEVEVYGGKTTYYYSSIANRD